MTVEPYERRFAGLWGIHGSYDTPGPLSPRKTPRIEPWII